MSSSAPLVSVVIPCYNCTQYIVEALACLRAQTFRDFETILVNDGCPDTENLERALEPYRGEITYIGSREWASVSTSRNTGIKAARGRYVAFLDADDRWEHDYLSTHVGILESKPEMHLVFCNAILFGDSAWAGRTFVDPSIPAGETTLRPIVLLERSIYVGVTARRESLMQAGLFDPEVMGGEDWDLWMRLLRTGGRIWYSGRCLARYRQHQGMQSSRKLTTLRNHAGVFEKHLRLPGLSVEEQGWFESGLRKIRADMDLFTGKQALYAGRRAEAITLLSRANVVLRQRPIKLAILALRVAPGLLFSYIRRKYPTEYIYLH